MAPFEEVGESAVGNDDVGEGVRGERDIGHGLFVRGLLEAEFEYADGSKLHVQCRQMDNCANRMGFNVQGTKARADERYQFLDNQGNALWRYRDRDDPSSSQIEQDVFIGAILGSKPYVNNVEYGAESTMTTIMGRMAIESGEIIELGKAKASDLSIVPDPMSWDMKMPNAPLEDGNYAIPKPGVRVL